MKYCLANYVVTITPEDSSLKSMFGSISIGGQSQAAPLSSITIGYSNDQHTTKSYFTGAYVHEKNLSKVGTIALDLYELSNEVAKFIKLAKQYWSGDYNGCTITVSDNTGTPVTICNDCVITKIPDQVFGETSADQTWTFNSGKVVVMPNT